MTLYRVLILTLVVSSGVRPSLCDDDLGFTISVKATNDSKTAGVSVDGYVLHTISDDEAKTYGLDGDKLSNAVEKYLGKSPTNAFLKSPAVVDGKDLYEAEGWTEVKTVINATGSTVVDVTSNLVILKTTTLENDFSHNGTFNTGISEKISDTATSTWNTGGTFTVGEKISCKVGFLGDDAESETSFSYSQTWGIAGSHAQDFTVGSEDGASVNLEPGEKVKIVLSASQGVMKVRVNYVSHLIGMVAINYRSTYEGHHFLGLPVADMMDSLGLTNSIASSEVIEIGFYTNVKITMMNGTTDEVLSELAVPLRRVFDT